jgi:hypothetical protein
MKFKILARHKHLTQVTITESIGDDDETRRYTATILGWRN